MGQKDADGPASSGGHRGLDEARQSGVPHDWVLKRGSPAFREAQKLKAEAAETEKSAKSLVEKLVRFYPELSGWVEVRISGGASFLAVLEDETFQLKTRQQYRLAVALEKARAQGKE
jgi:hypothetical protein